MSNITEKKVDYEKGNVAGKEVDIEGHDVETPEGGEVQKRKADTEIKKVHEAFNSIFEGVELPEDFSAKAEGILEAYINEAVKQREEAIAEAADSRLSDIVEGIEARFTETADKYLDFVAERWINENRIAVVAESKVATATAIVEGLVDLLAKHNIKLSESETDKLAELEDELKEAKSRYNEIAEELIQEKAKTSKLMAEMVLKEIQEGMVMADAEKLASLVEDFDTSDLPRYRVKVEAVKESTFVKSASAETKDGLFEEFNGSTAKTTTNAPMNSILEEVRKRM